jgi:microcin C transport system substrate-binding protein
VEQYNFDSVRRGLIQKRKIFNNAPQGFSGFAMNTRRAPFDDIRVRKALTLLLDRQKLIEKLMFNQYVPLNSYYAGSEYENHNNPKNEYNPQEALKFLAEAGWNSRDAQGRLVKNGQPLDIELLYDNKMWEPQLTVYQEDLRKAGINLNLRLITPEQQFQMISERRFQMSLTGWGALLFPNPETSFFSTLADVNSTNNITGFKNARVDELCKAYDKMFNIQDRINANREIDGILANAYHYVLLWDAPYQRIAYWNKFGMPPGYFPRTGDTSAVWQMWWIDPAKDAKLQQALRNSSMKLEVGADEDRYWLDYTEKEKQAHPEGRKTS